MPSKYEGHLHAMQSGVAMEMHRNPAPTEPKHLRVGINASKADQAGLVKLLIAKGLFTEDEYVEAITESMADEVKRYEELLTDMTGGKVKITLR